MIVKDYQPLSIVENEDILSFSMKLQPLYTPATRKTISSNLLPELHEDTKLKFKNILRATTHVAITTDMWTSDSMKSFLAVTAHFNHNDTLRAVC